MFIATLSTTAKLWKEPKHPSTDEGIKKLWSIYTMEYYVAMRKNEIWSYVDPKKLNRRPWGRGRKKKVREGESQTIRDS